MLPQFPQFKGLDLGDKEDVEKITSKYPPYSDFNFVSMWSWDTRGDMRISELNNNLVVRFTDYLTGNPFFSFLGDNLVNETVEKLLEFSREQGLPVELKLIPEIVVDHLDKNKFKIIEDREHFDYIYDIHKLTIFNGSEYADKRNQVNSFLKSIDVVETRILDLRDINTKKGILNLNNIWLKNKKIKDPFFDIKNELIAIDRFLNMNSNNLYSIGIFSKGELIAYSINDVCDSNYAVGHFYKANDFNGVFSYLMRESAFNLEKVGIKFLNFEQDLGILGLRISKNSYKPVSFLKKYILSSF